MKDTDRKPPAVADEEKVERREWVARAVASARRSCKDDQDSRPQDDPDQAIRDETKFV